MLKLAEAFQEMMQFWNFLFGSLKWLSKDGAIPFESYSVLFDGAMFKLVWWCNFEISIWYSCIRWCNIKYLYLDLSQSISILIYPNLYLSISILIYQNLSWYIIIVLIHTSSRSESSNFSLVVLDILDNCWKVHDFNNHLDWLS